MTLADALAEAVAALEYPEDDYRHRPWGLRDILLRHLDFRGSDAGIREWFAENRERLVWDPGTGKFRVRD